MIYFLIALGLMSVGIGGLAWLINGPLDLDDEDQEDGE